LSTGCNTFVNPAAVTVGDAVLVSARGCVSSAKMRKRTPASLPTNAISGFGSDGGSSGGVTKDGSNNPVKPTLQFC